MGNKRGRIILIAIVVIVVVVGCLALGPALLEGLRALHPIPAH
jgi:hypothetical protein